MKALLRWEMPAKFAVDVAIVFVSFTAALALRFDANIPAQSLAWFFRAFPAIAALYLASNLLLRVYGRWWRYASFQDAVTLAQAIALATATLLAVDLLFFPQRDFPLSVVLVGGGITYVIMALCRLRARLPWRLLFPSRRSSGARLLIVGAGRVGQMLAHELVQHREWDYRPICFVDDDPKKRGVRIHGVPVGGARDDIPALVAQHSIEIIAIAMPSASGPEIRELVTICQATNARITLVSGIPEMMNGRRERQVLRDLTVTDLLGRQMVEIDAEACRGSIAGKVVLVTGAAGSIGRELCIQLIKLGPAKLLAVDNNESGLHDLGIELALHGNKDTLELRLLDVVDSAAVNELFAARRPHVVFHAAAYKHVPLMERHVSAAFRINVLGTLGVCLAAERHHVARLIFISSDKAVKPSSVMGATKRIGEHLVAAIGSRGGASYCAVRFGNVLGSRGSVAPTFWRQIEAGGPVTVTHPDASRFFITINEAASLVIEAANFARAGEIFLLDMGEEIKIVDLAHKMIRLRGLRPGQDVEIVFTGLRPGEKLREELLGDGEMLDPTGHPKVLRVRSDQQSDRAALLRRVDALAAQPTLISRAAIFELLEAEANVFAAPVF